MSRANAANGDEVVGERRIASPQRGAGRMVTTGAESGGNTVMRDAVAVVTHESSANGASRQPGTDLFIQMSEIESIGRAGLRALMVRPDRTQRCSAEFGGRAAARRRAIAASA